MSFTSGADSFLQEYIRYSEIYSWAHSETHRTPPSRPYLSVAFFAGTQSGCYKKRIAETPFPQYAIFPSKYFSKVESQNVQLSRRISRVFQRNRHANPKDPLSYIPSMKVFPRRSLPCPALLYSGLISPVPRRLRNTAKCWKRPSAKCALLSFRIFPKALSFRIFSKIPVVISPVPYKNTKRIYFSAEYARETFQSQKFKNSVSSSEYIDNSTTNTRYFP